MNVKLKGDVEGELAIRDNPEGKGKDIILRYRSGSALKEAVKSEATGEETEKQVRARMKKLKEELENPEPAKLVKKKVVKPKVKKHEQQGRNSQKVDVKQKARRGA